jgi:hypothetical protein
MVKLRRVVGCRKFYGGPPAFNDFLWRSAMSYFWVVLAILGAAALGASMTVIRSYEASMLVIVLGGVLVQASIMAAAMNFGREKREPRRRRYGVGTAV